MRISSSKIRAWIAVLTFGLGMCSWAQDAAPSPSLGDLARKVRKDHSSVDHVPAKQVTNEEEDGPDAGGVWRVTLCSQTPCYELSIALPKTPKWIRPAAAPRPVLIPLVGHEDDLSRAIRVYAAESLGPSYPSADVAKRAFLQGLFARPEYFGQAAHIVLDEHFFVDGGLGVLTHFTVISGDVKFRGFGITASVANGNYGFACAFHEEDSVAASSICDAIVKSAHSQILLPAQPRYYPTYQVPQYYPRYDDPRDNDD
jgi:hypothetical protein